MWRASNFRAPTSVQLEAIKLVGARQVVKDGIAFVEPAYGLQVIRGVTDALLDEQRAEADRIFREMGVSQHVADMLMKYKKVVRAPLEQGDRLQIVPRVPGLDDDNLSDYTDFTEPVNESAPVLESRSLIYKLNTVFSDSTLQDKLCIPSRRMQLARRLATTDAGEAAQMLTAYIHVHGFPNCRVTAGDYSKSLTCARNYIHQWADTIQYKDTMVPTRTSPTHLYMTYDAFEDTPLWTVSGPVKHGVEVLAVYQLAIHHGPEYVLFFAGLETVMLGINIHNDKTNEAFTGTLSGYSSMSGIVPMGHEFPPELTAEQTSRLFMAAAKVMPVRCDDRVVGSAVRVSDRHVLVNSHTVSAVADLGKTATVAGEVITTVKSVAYDVSVVNRSGGEAQWTLREPTVGERVVLAYSVGESVEFSEVLRVMSSHRDMITLSQSNILRRGASGAVVIALRDFAMLGLFASVRGYDVLCVAFSSRHFSQIVETDSVVSPTSVDNQGDDVGSVTYNRMLRRGLGSYLDAINLAVAPLYRHEAGAVKLAGTVANYSGAWHTSVNPQFSQLYMADQRSLLFERVSTDRYKCVEPPPILNEVPNVRDVQPGERVCVFARDGDSVVMSRVLTVLHYTVGSSHFMIEDLGSTVENLVGGLIVSERDAAVLGQFVALREDSYGQICGVCVCAPPSLDTAIASPVVVGIERFCVSFLTGRLQDYLMDETYYTSMGQSADALMAMQRGRIVTMERGVSSDGIMRSDVRYRTLFEWLGDAFGVARDKYDDYSNLVARVMWLLGYLYAESRLVYDQAYDLLHSPDGVVPSLLTAPGSGVSQERARSVTPVLARTYSSEISQLRVEIDELRKSSKPG